MLGGGRAAAKEARFKIDDRAMLASLLSLIPLLSGSLVQDKIIAKCGLGNETFFPPAIVNYARGGLVGGWLRGWGVGG
jgi:hypothetical protein